jgi:predicted permease
MSNILLILISLLGGILLNKYKILPNDSAKTLNSFIIYLSLPAITFYYIPKSSWNLEMTFPFLMPVLVLGLSTIFFLSIQPILKYSKQTLGALILVAGMGNISFVGYPVIEAVYGGSGLEIAIMVGQGGFLSVSVLGVLIAMKFSSKSGKLKEIAWNVLKFPPFIAFLLVLPLSFLKLDFSEPLQDSFKQLGGTLTPLAMVSVGLQISFDFKGINWKNVLVGLSFKLLFAPILILLIAKVLLASGSLIGKVSILEAAMPSMVTASIIATEYNLNPKLANFLVGFGLLISGFTLVFWWWILK